MSSSRLIFVVVAGLLTTLVTVALIAKFSDATSSNTNVTASSTVAINSSLSLSELSNDLTDISIEPQDANVTEFFSGMVAKTFALNGTVIIDPKLHSLSSVGEYKDGKLGFMFSDHKSDDRFAYEIVLKDHDVGISGTVDINLPGKIFERMNTNRCKFYNEHLKSVVALAYPGTDISKPVSFKAEGELGNARCIFTFKNMTGQQIVENTYDELWKVPYAQILSLARGNVISE